MTTRHLVWGEDRVTFFDAQRRLCSMLTSWTDVQEADAFAQASAGRSWVRMDDLLRLRALIDELGGAANDVK